MNNTHSSPSPTAIDDWVRACARIVPWRRPAQLRQLQFHCGKPPPAAEPSTYTRIAAESLWVGAAILAKTPGRALVAFRTSRRVAEPRGVRLILVAERLLFLTGKLAEPGLCRILGALPGPELSYEVFNIGVSVAALMSAEMIARRLDGPRGADRVIVPGLCAGDLTVPAEKLGIPVVRGPEDMKDLPGFLGRGGVPPDLSRYDIRIFAEIVDAPRLAVDGILDRAARAMGPTGPT
ncbi:MAG: hypothetical protein H0U97_21250 [Gammaproteobacteria bacterium]|nr:hypothetical protein [Gammaproteobacteria bacterium]